MNISMKELNSLKNRVIPPFYTGKMDEIGFYNEFTKLSERKLLNSRRNSPFAISTFFSIFVPEKSNVEEMINNRKILKSFTLCIFTIHQFIH